MIIKLIAFACIGVLWIVSEPTIRLREWAFGNRNNFFTRLLSCSMCSSFHIYFWWELLINGHFDIGGAAIVAIMAALIDKWINNNLTI
jgi:hypothetical protein